MKILEFIGRIQDLLVLTKKADVVIYDKTNEEFLTVSSVKLIRDRIIIEAD